MFTCLQARRERRVRARSLAIRFLAKHGEDAVGALLFEADRRDTTRDERKVARLAIREIRMVQGG